MDLWSQTTLNSITMTTLNLIYLQKLLHKNKQQLQELHAEQNSHLSVLHELNLQLLDLHPEKRYGLAGLVLVDRDSVLDVPRPVGVFECVEGLHKVAVAR